MALPKIDTPVYELTLPLSKKQIKFRPFLVKEQKNLLMAIEADDNETIERNIKQVLHNCTLSENVNIDKLPVLDVEYYFLNLRARSVGEVVENKYICNNVVEGVKCGNKMDVAFNLLDIQVESNPEFTDVIQLTNTISIKLKYPEFSVMEKVNDKNNAVDLAFRMIVDSIEYVFDGDQYYYAEETSQKELTDFIESLNAQQFDKIEKFFQNLPKLNKKVDMKCSKCGYDHSIVVEGLENFFE